jgi:hypothetical protein
MGLRVLNAHPRCVFLRVIFLRIILIEATASDCIRFWSPVGPIYSADVKCCTTGQHMETNVTLGKRLLFTHWVALHFTLDNTKYADAETKYAHKITHRLMAKILVP